MTATIDELLAQGRAKIEAEKAKQEKDWAEETQQVERERLARVETYTADVLAAVGPELYRFFARPSEPFDPDHDSTAEFHVPGCAPIEVLFNKNRSTGRYHPYNDPIAYTVLRPKYDQYDDRIRWLRLDSTDLSLALAYAEIYRRDLDKINQDAEARKAKAEQRRREHDEQEARDEQARLDRIQQRDAEREDLLDLIGADPIAYHLMRAFLGIQNERAAWQDKLDSCNDAMAEIEGAHERHMEHLEQCLRDAQRNVEDARARESEARDEASATERKLKQAKRGW